MFLPQVLRVIVCLSGLAFAAQPDTAIAVELSHPSGLYAVGRIGYDWVDKHRADEFSLVPSAHRELMVYIWYPATKPAVSEKTADYLPNADVIQKKLSPEDLESYWGPSRRKVFSGEIRVASIEGLPVADHKKHFPVLIFSPGLGMRATSYTALIEEVASQGYIVAAIEPIYEAGVVVFADGRVVRSVPAAGVSRRPLPGEGRAQVLERARREDAPVLDRRSEDIRFVINQLSKIQGGPLAGHMDLRRIGVWGHSMGGRAAARACQLDLRIRACLNADGGGLDGPVALYPGAALPSQPFMLMGGPAPPAPTDAILASYKISREDWQKERAARVAAYEQQMQSFPGGSYAVNLTMPGMAHMSFSDQPLIDAATEVEFRQASHNLRAIEAYTVAFFDKYLKHRGGTILDVPKAAPEGVLVKKYRRLSRR